MVNEGQDKSTNNVDNENNVDNGQCCNVADNLPRNPSLEERLASKMLSYSRETICLFVGAITFGIALAALQNAAPRVSKPPTARPFFNENSVVIDFYKGQISAMKERGLDADVSFVMYYAPWDAESQIVRKEFEIVARHYHSQVFFAAINCWHPGSECRAQYPKIQSYPVLMVYPLRGVGTAYRGIRTAPYIMRFLNNYLHPLTHISVPQDLPLLLLSHDVIFVGFFNFSGLASSPGYQEFYKTAVRSLEGDPNREMKFAVVTSPQAAEAFDQVQYPSASLILWNETLIFPPDGPWTSDNLIQWLDQAIHRVSTWIQPPGTKSLTLAPYLSKGPVLFLFTPRNPLHPENYNYNLLREVALEYHDCENLPWLTGMTKNLQILRHQSQLKHFESTKICSESLKWEESISLSVSLGRWVNDSCCAKIFMNKCLLCRDRGPGEVCEKGFREICNQEDVFKMTKDPEDLDKHFCCNEDPQKSSTSSSRSQFFSSTMPKSDPQSSENLKRRRLREWCRYFIAGNKYHQPIFPAGVPGDEDKQLRASSCSTNQSLTFIAIDSLRYFHFAEGLGIDLVNLENRTAVVIVDPMKESQYLMEEALARESLVKFIDNFSEGSLHRALRVDTGRRFAGDFQGGWECEGKADEVCVQELTTDNFLQTVLDPQKNIIVLYHSPYCAFCGAVGFVYLTVAKYLRRMNNLAFVRIDGDNNDLPWEYSMNRYPAILFFPAKRKEDSTVYPFSLPITIPNLLNFVLTNLNDDSHIEALVNVCHTGSGEPPKDCVARIRRLCLDIIHNQLGIYRKLPRQRKYLPKMMLANRRRDILRRLEHIRDIHLILSSVEDLGTDEIFFKILRKFRIYYKSLRTTGSQTCDISTKSRDNCGVRSRDEL